MREEVDALLEAHHGAGSFGDAPAFAPPDETGSVTSQSIILPPTGSRRAPWWMYVIAASYVALLALIPYLVIWGPADLLGVTIVFEDAGMVLRSVDRNSLLGVSGLQSGDRILAVDGMPIRNVREWTAFQNNLEVGRIQRWQILRESDRLELDVTPVRGTWRNRLANGYVSYTGLTVISFAVGLFIAFRRPYDPVARVGAWFIATASIAFGLPNGWAVTWREIPEVVRAFFWIPEISRFVLEGIFLSLFVIFPRRLFRAHWPWIVIWLPVIVTLPWRVLQFHAVIFGPVESLTGPAWVNQVIFLRTIVYLAAGIVVVILGYRRLLDPNEKRRVRVMTSGTAIGLAAAMTMIALGNFSNESEAGAILVVAFFHPLIVACPLAFAYAILRHRVFDIQVIIRQGLQYALARGSVIGIVPVLGLILILDLVLNSQEPLATIMQSRGWIYASLSVLALITYLQRKPWLEALDRRFFRERYNAQRVLRDVVEEIRDARSFERVSPRVVARIETALHPEFVSLMVRQPDEPHYRPLASFPSGKVTLSLPADGKLVALMRALEKPVEGLLTNSSWFEQRLPRDEIKWVRRTRIDLLVPVVIGTGRKEALLALGIKRSEEPYTREDQEMLEVIASNLGLLLDQTADGSKAPAETFEECPKCGLCYDFNTAKCNADAAVLTSTRLPRILVGRYRLEKRRGRGGMGTVYEASDGALERRVAVKVIRDDWIGNVEAAQRFRREARAAAGFSHPNVVTVHDFGVEADTRGFLVMELLEGRSLREELELQKRLDPSRTISILRGVCAAVEAAHDRQLIHRDLKPENIFLSRGRDQTLDVVKVLDFGIAKFLGPSSNDAVTGISMTTHAGVLIGTPAYMSPEQLNGGSPDVSWDLWALGVVAYESLTGIVPFPAESPVEWRNAIQSGNFTPLDRHLPNPPAAWRDFFAMVLNRDPAKRPKLAGEFLRELEEALAQTRP